MAKKIFECKGGCANQYIDMVVLSCKKCIKHVSYPLTDDQKKRITQILNE